MNARYLFPLQVILISVSSLFIGQISQAQYSPLDGFDEYVAKSQELWGVPGLAVAVVEKGEVAFIKGYGVQKLGESRPVDRHTIFSMASTTKAFTAIALAMLVDDGKIEWDDPVVKYLSNFTLSDPYVTRKLTIRDLLTHRSGIDPNPANSLWSVGYDRKDIVHRMRYANVVAGFRSNWQYNNGMYIVAGEVIESVTGLSWESFVRDNILYPLGMTETFMVAADVQNRKNVASAHMEIDDVLQPVAYPSFDAVGAAGSMQSSVHDMAKWLTFLLDSTKVDNEPKLKPETYSELFRPQMTIAAPYPAANKAKSNMFAYGLGWFLQDYRGTQLIMHTGSLIGMNAIIGLLPEKNVAMVLLANRSGAEVRHALMYDVIDRYLGKRDKDWSQELFDLYREIGQRRKQAREEVKAKIEMERVENTSPSLQLGEYTGLYADSLWGTIEVVLESSGLVLKESGGANDIADLEHWHYDVFMAVWRDKRYIENRFLVNFKMNSNAKVTELVADDFISYKRSRVEPTQ